MQAATAPSSVVVDLMTWIYRWKFAFNNAKQKLQRWGLWSKLTPNSWVLDSWGNISCILLIFSSSSSSSSSVLASGVSDNRSVGFLHKKVGDLRRDRSIEGARENLLHTYVFFRVNDILVFGSDRSSISSKSEERTSSKTTPRAWGFGGALAGSIWAANQTGTNVKTHAFSIRVPNIPSEMTCITLNDKKNDISIYVYIY